LENFNDLLIILSALDRAPVAKLMNTWEALSSKFKNLKVELFNITSGKNGYKLFRGTINTFKGVRPCVPYLGMILCDLTFILEGSPDNLSIPFCINIQKLRRIADVLFTMKQFQDIKYEFKEIPELINLINDIYQNTIDVK